MKYKLLSIKIVGSSHFCHVSTLIKLIATNFAFALDIWKRPPHKNDGLKNLYTSNEVGIDVSTKYMNLASPILIKVGASNDKENTSHVERSILFAVDFPSNCPSMVRLTWILQINVCKFTVVTEIHVVQPHSFPLSLNLVCTKWSSWRLCGKWVSVCTFVVDCWRRLRPWYHISQTLSPYKH